MARVDSLIASWGFASKRIGIPTMEEESKATRWIGLIRSNFLGEKSKPATKKSAKANPAPRRKPIPPFKKVEGFAIGEREKAGRVAKASQALRSNDNGKAERCEASKPKRESLSKQSSQRMERGA
jgi:hypothetical protein